MHEVSDYLLLSCDFSLGAGGRSQSNGANGYEPRRESRRRWQKMGILGIAPVWGRYSCMTSQAAGRELKFGIAERRNMKLNIASQDQYDIPRMIYLHATERLPEGGDKLD
jgi:hypothetical protein